MSIGAGLLEGVDVVDLVDVSPDSIVYVDHQGLTYTPQNESGSGNVALYEVNNQTDQLDVNLRRYVRDYNEPTLMLNTIFGSTDFDVYDRRQERTLLSEDSGFDTDTWMLEITDASPELRFENFDDTQAAFYPYISIFDKVV